MKTREPGLDLLRCMALFFVVLFHSFLNNGYYAQPQTGIFMWLFGSLRWLSVSCIGIFLMLTGYLKCERTGFRSCWGGLPPVLLEYLAASALSIPIRHFCFGDTQPLSVWLTRLLSFRGVYYGWYVEMFVGLTLLSPFLNVLLGTLKQPRKLVLVLLVLTALPGATPLPLAPAFWRGMYPVTYYCLGAAIRKTQPKIPPAAGMMGALVIALGLGAATVLSTDDSLAKALTWEFGDLWIAAMAVCLFLALYRVRPGKRLQKWLAFGSGGCYGGYLLSHLLDGWCYRLARDWHTPAQYHKLLLFVTIPIFIVSILAGKALSRLTSKIPSRKESVP